MVPCVTPSAAHETCKADVALLSTETNLVLVLTRLQPQTQVPMVLGSRGLISAHQRRCLHLLVLFPDGRKVSFNQLWFG